MEKMTRRELLQKSGKAAAGIGIAAALSGVMSAPVGAAETKKKKPGANDKIRIGLIGCGGMGIINIQNLMNNAEVDVIAACDVDTRRLVEVSKVVQRRRNMRPQTFDDFRNLLELKDLDAVCVSTPDHWHALPMIYACEAGLDTYVEKPIGHNIVEGKAMVAAAKKYGSVVQVGTWQRSAQHYTDAQRYLQSGKLGKIHLVRAWTCGGGGIGKVAPSEAPKELNWDAYIGPAAYEPYRANIHPHSFRWYFNYAAGLTGDWGVHMLDTVTTFMNQWHPQEVASYGGKLFCGPDDDRTTPDTQIAIYKFPDWVLQWEIHVGEPGLDGGGHHGVEFIGTDQIMRIDRNGVVLTDRAKKPLELPKTDPVPTDHWKNFLDCMRSRELPRSDIETMHYTTTMCHLANVAYLTGRSVKWDSDKGEVVGDSAAMNTLPYQREYRSPWSLPRHDKG